MYAYIHVYIYRYIHAHMSCAYTCRDVCCECHHMVTSSCRHIIMWAHHLIPTHNHIASYRHIIVIKSSSYLRISRNRCSRLNETYMLSKSSSFLGVPIIKPTCISATPSLRPTLNSYPGPNGLAGEPA